MQVAEAFAQCGPDELKGALAGGKLVVYSVARPVSPDQPVERSGVLATFIFAASFPAGEPQAALAATFTDNPVKATGVGTPGFARAYAADGATVVADFSAGAGDTDIKLSEVSTVPDFPIAVTRFNLAPAG